MEPNSPRRWDLIWSAERGTLFGALRRSLNRELARRLAGGGRLLEAGCGSSSLIEHLPKSVGIDFSAAACRISRKKIVHVVKGDIRSLPFRDRSFDAVFSQGVLQTAQDPVAMAREMMRVSRGTVLFTIPRRFSVFHLLSACPLWRGIPQRYWGENTLRALFGEWDVQAEKVWHGQLLCVTLRAAAPS